MGVKLALSAELRYADAPLGSSDCHDWSYCNVQQKRATGN